MEMHQAMESLTTAQQDRLSTLVGDVQTTLATRRRGFHNTA
jgi:hypothetical protein